METITEDTNLKRMQQCSRFDECSVPLCPLDAEMGQQIRLSEEQVCTLPKSIRTRLGTDLPGKGLFPKELAGLKSWLKKTEAERVQAVSRTVLSGAPFRFAPRPQNRKEKKDGQ